MEVENSEITSVREYVEIIAGVDLKPQSEVFFRGHSDSSGHLIPSVLRCEQFYKNERSMYFELIRECPDDFQNMNKHINVLTSMQHYGLPTRLLDLTSNALNALFFATEIIDTETTDGKVLVFLLSKEEMKFDNSDVVAMLSSLPPLKYEDKLELQKLIDDHISSGSDLPVLGNDNLSFLRLLDEIHTEKPAFTSRMKKSLIDVVPVKPRKNNKRIVHQDGLFLLYGLGDAERMEQKVKNNYVTREIIVKNKKQIRAELKNLGITQKSLFPDVESVAQYIKSCY